MPLGKAVTLLQLSYTCTLAEAQVCYGPDNLGNVASGARRQAAFMSLMACMLLQLDKSVVWLLQARRWRWRTARRTAS